MSRNAAVENSIGRELAARIVGAGPLSGERSEKLRCVWEGLLDLYDQRQAAAWLNTAVPALENRPLDLMCEEGGLDRVLDLVTRMTWGLSE